VDLLWTSPGDDGDSGKAARYDIRYAKTSLSEENWLSATVFLNTMSPKESGINEATTVSGLESGVTYYFAIKTSDEALNESLISNIIAITTLAAPKDKEVITPKASGAGFSEGDLIKASGDERVYVIKNDKKVWIPTAEAFIEAGYKWSDIQEVSASDVAVVASGNLLRVEGDPKVYIVERGLKRHIPNPESFNSYSYKWEDVVEITTAHLAGYKDAALMRALDDFKVYLLEGNTKQWIKTAQDFNNAGYDWNEVLDVSRVELESYETKEGALVKLIIEGDEFSFSPTTINVKRGDIVELIFKNVGTIPHNYIVDELGLGTKIVDSGQTDIVTFTTPSAAGSITYASYCSLPGHLEAGMEGLIVIE